MGWAWHGGVCGHPAVGPGFSLRGCLVVELHRACEWVMVQIQALMQCSAGMLFDCPH